MAASRYNGALLLVGQLIAHLVVCIPSGHADNQPQCCATRQSEQK